MRGKTGDLLATILVAAIAVPYIGYLINGEMPLIQDPRGMSATGLVLGVLAFQVLRRGDAFDRLGKIEIGLGLVSLTLGLVALILAETATAGNPARGLHGLDPGGLGGRADGSHRHTASWRPLDGSTASVKSGSHRPSARLLGDLAEGPPGARRQHPEAEALPFSRMSETLIEAANRVWYATLTEG